jgi:hypothetical protein
VLGDVEFLVGQLEVPVPDLDGPDAGDKLPIIVEMTNWNPKWTSSCRGILVVLFSSIALLADQAARRPCIIS